MVLYVTDRYGRSWLVLEWASTGKMILAPAPEDTSGKPWVGSTIDNFVALKVVDHHGR